MKTPHSFLLRGLPGICLAWLLLLPSRPSEAARTQTTRTLLQPGVELIHRLPDGQVNEYEVEPAAGRFLRVAVREIDLVGTLALAAYSPDGGLQVRSRKASSGFRHEIYFVAARNGRHRLTIGKTNRVQTSGRYAVRIVESRPAVAADAERLALQEALREANELKFQADAASLRQALARFKDISSKFAELIENETKIDLLSEIGLTHNALKEPEEAATAYQAASRLAEAVGDHYRRATTLFYLSELHRQANRHSPALAGYEQVVLTAQNAGNLRAESFAANNAGVVLMELGEYPQAARQFERALELFLQHHEPSAVTPLSNLGVLYTASGESEKAFAYFRRTAETCRKFQFKAKEVEAVVGSAFLYYSLGEMAAALNYYQRALALAETYGNLRSNPMILTGLGASSMGLGENEKARRFYEQALSLQREVKDRRNEGITLGALGLLAEAQGDPPQARRLLLEGLALVRGAFDRRFEIAGLVKLGAVEEALGETESARGRFTEALALSERLHDRLGQADARFGLARLAVATDVAEARAQMETALGLIETQRRHIAGHSLRAAYFASVRRYHEFYVDLLMRQAAAADRDKLTRSALEAAERARARGLLDLLGETRVDLRADVAPELLARERELQQALNAATDYHQQLLSRLTPKSQTEAALQRIDRLTIELNEAQARIRATGPRYAALTAPPPVTAEEIQRELLDADTALLEYQIGERRSYLWIVTKESLAGYELPSRAEIERQALRVRALLIARQPAAGESETARAKRIADADREFPGEAEKLSRLLLPASNLNKSRLAIVADGALQYVPFAVLSRAGKPLIADHEIVYLPSASTLATLRRELKGRVVAPKTLAVFADPVFEKDDPRLTQNRKPTVTTAQRTMRGESQSTSSMEALRALRDAGDATVFSRLLYSRREANRILSFVPEAGQRLAALDFAANRAAAFDSKLMEFRFLHFATHGVLDEVHPELSGVVLSLLDETGRPQAGFLRLHEIYKLKLNAELVSLSACRTGLGKEIRGEGLIGLTRGFMFAGAPRVLSSLWKVQDDATAELMEQFYRALLLDGQRPAEALRTAQLAMLKKVNRQAPFYWAAFTLQGEWR